MEQRERERRGEEMGERELVEEWRTMCTSELGENPADDAAAATRSGSFLPLVPLFSASDSDIELSSMGLFFFLFFFSSFFSSLLPPPPN